MYELYSDCVIFFVRIGVKTKKELSNDSVLCDVRAEAGSSVSHIYSTTQTQLDGSIPTDESGAGFDTMIKRVPTKETAE
jgi:hypothetical protein